MAQLSREELEKKIAGLERGIGSRLPGDYKDFLMKDEKTWRDADRFECKLRSGGRWKGRIDYLFKFSETPWDDLEGQNREAKDAIPAKTLAIADAANDDKLLMSLNRKDHGKIYFWDHNEKAPEDEPPARDNLYPVADSFSGLLSGLREGREMVKTRLSKDHLLNKIAEFEKQIGDALPQDYRDFLLEFNGGRPDKSGFDYDLPDGRTWNSMVREFIGFDRSQYSDFDYFDTMYFDRIPPGMFPIADDPGGNLVLMSLRPESRENIFFWDHNEEAEEEEPATLENLYFIAGNFSEFFAGLKEEEAV